MGFVKSVASRLLLADPDSTERQMDTATVLHFDRSLMMREGLKLAVLPVYVSATVW